ncbi:cell division ATP-binding protein FtsE [Desulfovibrio psychrotolerans]|uniref:Cell division ATP-binding protein FtsE n=2 Tax=Desulfovibrio psychrotolerans TaxID=415242 RepID=A0A7J0BY51_9BACT|nr:cell division ATP-binding protein FtsE [Desulfovibrio psychrotolerans]
MESMLKVHHLSHNFGSHWALKNCSFELEKGDFLFLSGPSGAGKTTLLRLLYASLPVQRGSVEVAGFNLNKLKPRQVPLLRRQVSVVFQDFKILPHRSVYQNIAIALEVRCLPAQHIDRRVRAVVRGLGLENRIDTPCGELSGGEQQRVAVARSIVVNPQILLADEPTGNLDPELSMRMMDIFKQFHSYGTTVVLATHSRDLLARHPKAKLLRLDDGKITEANWPGAIIENCTDDDDTCAIGPLTMPDGRTAHGRRRR